MNIKIHNLIFLFLSLLLCSFLAACKSRESTLIGSDELECYLSECPASTSPDTVEEASPISICVCITGAVLNPGVYYLDAGSRVFQLINAAGGLCPDADIDKLNLVAALSDGMQLNIISRNDPPDTANTESTDSSLTASGSYAGLSDSNLSQENSSSRININTATVSQLTSLPSIGETRARAIVQYREDNKGFKSIEDIKNVSGIKEGTFEKIKDLICVN